MSVVQTRFLPPPAIYEISKTGLIAVEPSKYIENPRQYKFASFEKRLITNFLPSEAENFIHPPNDLYCPSMQEKLDELKLKKLRKTDLFASSILVAEYSKRGKNIPFINMFIKWVGGGECPQLPPPLQVHGTQFCRFYTPKS